MSGWINSQTALAYFAGCMTAIIFYVADWLWHVKRKPKPGKPFSDKTVAAALKENERRRREDQHASPPPSRSLMAPSRRREPIDPDDVEEELRLDTADLPETREHPAPSTAMIDFTRPPPPNPYTGPERRLRSDNPYPELRRRAEDRERAEAEAAARPAPPPFTSPSRETRAERRRRLEAGNTEGDHTDTDGE